MGSERLLASVTFALALALALVACGSNTDAAQDPARDVDAIEAAAESTEVIPEDADSPTATADLGDGSTSNAVSESSPPTTETAGLVSAGEVSSAPDGLTCVRVEDFGEEAADRWRVINDGVMGGLSEGELAFDGGVATFSGVINTNGGGFSMIRTSTFRDGASLADSLEEAEYLLVRTRSANGRGYELTVQDSTTNAAVMHFGDIVLSADSAWEEVLVPLTDLEARTFGTAGPALADFDLSQISTLGVILADGLDGPFSIAIDRIDACAEL